MTHTSTVRRPEASGLPVELLGSVPRDVRLTGGGIAVAAVAIAFVVGALVAAITMSVAYLRSEADRQVRQREAIAADAEVVQVAVVRGEKKTRFDVIYRYAVDGRSHTGRARLGERGRAMVAGAPIRIGYLASHPETSWLSGREPSGFPFWVIPLVTLLLLLAAAAVAWTVRRQWLLLSEGRGAQARVTATKKVHSDKHRAYRVSYEFRTISGATMTSKCDVAKAPPALGAMIPIVYHRDAPQWSAVYPLQLVRPGRLVN